MYYNQYFYLPSVDLFTPALKASMFRIMRGLGLGCATGFVLCISSLYIEKSLACLRLIDHGALQVSSSVTYFNDARDFQ